MKFSLNINVYSNRIGDQTLYIFDIVSFLKILVYKFLANLVTCPDLMIHVISKFQVYIDLHYRNLIFLKSGIKPSFTR